MRTRAAIALAALIALAACDARQAADTDEVPVGDGFDFYVLALSWSPSYCAAEGDRANRTQCHSDADYGFIVHGLWPQFERGWPEFCGTDQTQSISPQQVRAMEDIMPSAGLMRHQWTKHGSCSGLSQDDYFAVTRHAFERVALPETLVDRTQPEMLDPDAIEAAFRQSNATLPASAIAVTCDRQRLREVRICLSRDLADFTACPEVDRRSCRLDSVVVPPNN